MKSIPAIKNGLKLAISLLQEGVNDLRQMQIVSVSVCAAEVGETIDEKELQQLQSSWSRELICPICDRKEGNKPYIQESNAKHRTPLESDLVKDLLSKSFSSELPDYVGDMPRQDYSFDNEKAFDEHMKVVHGITINHDQAPIDDMRVLNKYGPACSDQRYGTREVKEVKNPKKYVNKILSRIEEYED